LLCTTPSIRFKTGWHRAGMLRGARLPHGSCEKAAAGWVGSYVFVGVQVCSL